MCQSIPTSHPKWVPSTQIWALLHFVHKNQTPTTRFSVFHPNSPTSHSSQSPPFNPSTPVHPPNGSPPSNYKPPCVESAKTEPQWLSLWFFHQIPPPLHINWSPHLSLSNPIDCTTIKSPLPYYDPPPPFRSPKLTSSGLVFVFGSNQAFSPSCITQPHFSYHLKLSTPPQTGPLPFLAETVLQGHSFLFYFILFYFILFIIIIGQ
jgi:hypothetical protein